MRVDRSFGFVDICGFTSFTEQQGDDAAVEMLAEFRGAVRRVASQEGIRIAKWLGDGAMIVGVEPEHLLTGMLDIVEHRYSSNLRLRAGVACGPVILFEGDDHIGAAVNLASRLCDAARPGSVLVSQEAAAYAAVADSEVIDEGTLRLQGIDHPVPALRLLRPQHLSAVS